MSFRPRSYGPRLAPESEMMPEIDATNTDSGNGQTKIALGFCVRILLLFLITGFYIATVVVNIRDERQLIQDDIRRISSVTTVSAQKHTEAIFEFTAQTLEALRSDLSITNDSRSAQQILDDHFFAPPYLRATMLLDANGIIVASTFRETIGNDGGDFPFFSLQRDNSLESKIYTGDFVVGEISRAPHFFSSIALRDKNGNFVNVIAAAYELTYFRNLYRQLVPGDNFAIALFHVRDGLIVASDSEIHVGELPKSSKFPSNLQIGDHGQGATLSVLLDGGHTAHTAIRPVNAAPFFVSTMADVDGLLTNHRRDNLVRYALAALFVATVIGLAIALEIYIFNRRRAEAANRALEIELRQSHKMEALGTLAGGLAHDFNNLLSSIIGFGEVVRERVDENPRLTGPIDQILLAGRRAESIVSQILAFSRRTESSRKPIRLDRVISEVLDLIRVSIPASINVSTTINDIAPWIVGDASQLHQVLMNLCSNAVQAMPNGGDLSIRLDRIEIDEATAQSKSGLHPATYIEVSVKDTGKGIEAGIRDRIFDPFFTTKARGKGTGLGLSIVHGIVATHEGAVDVASEPGQGTVVCLLFPACEPGVESSADDRPPILDGGGRAVMLVDDDEGVVDLMEERLAGFGFEPFSFSDSKEAWRAFAATPGRFDLVITDYSMPEMDGLTLAELILGKRSDLPIILMTGYGDAEITSRARRIGVSEIVRKPLHLRKIAESIAHVM